MQLNLNKHERRKMIRDFLGDTIGALSLFGFGYLFLLFIHAIG